ncbi:MAG TPA: M48 family metalloprotease [Burkholderiales bacterium]|nr:M48 family metalloprotease [Burkholderiales bacterium]
MSAHNGAIVLALAAALLSAGCESAGALKGVQIGGVDVGQLAENVGGLREIKEPEEIEMGKGVAETLLGASPLLDDVQLQRYVNAVGGWVAQQSERPDLPWHFAVNSSEVVNAAATPGGNIIITAGMLRVLRNEAELAGVLGHEVAHAVRKHHLAAIRKSAFAGLLAQGVQAASQGNRNEQLVNALIGPTKELYARGLDKSDEFEADRMGVVLAARAGYDPWGLPNAVQTLSSIKPDDNAVALLFKTHPAPSARLERLAAAMGESFDAMQGPRNEERYRQATARIRVASR